ncbi:MAG: TetR/AcrR family transcriptional regulator, partial [Trebonia sp.]
ISMFKIWCYGRCNIWVMRSYNSPRRRDAALATHAAILESARRLFLARGYAEVTVGDIAAAARVAIPTIYGSTGGKAAILRALLAPVVDDPAVEQTLTGIAATDDPGMVIAITAAGTRQAQERHWELVWGLLYRNIAEPSAAPVVDETKRAYLDAMAAVAGRLMALDALKPELDHATAVDLLWFYLGRPGWYTLVGDRAWDFNRAEAWLADAARQALLRKPRRGDYRPRARVAGPRLAPAPSSPTP